MTIPQERREELRRLADGATPGPWSGKPAVSLAPDTIRELLDALTRAEAQSETRRLDIEYWKERAETFQQEALDERGAALDALDSVKDRDARIADVLALCDEWAAMGTRSMNIGAVRRALEGSAHRENTALGRAEADWDREQRNHAATMRNLNVAHARIKAVEDLCARAARDAGKLERNLLGGHRLYPKEILRALDGTAPPPAE